MSAALPPLHGLGSTPMPAQIGPYAVRAVIGIGSMGVVYLGHDPVINRPVAIKTIQRHLLEASARQHSAEARFRVEAQAAGRLSHRNIVSIYQFGEDENCAYIVMEYVRGHSLAEYMRRHERLTKDEVLCLTMQLLDALHYAHEAGVVHRDVKPANLMVDDEGRLKITDFGIARTETSQVTRVNAVIGSPGYMAPEQYTGGALDRRVDVFSVGVLLYQMLTGALPFSGKTDEAIMYQIVYGQHEPVSKVAADPSLAMFDAIVDGALAKTAAQRYSTAWEFRDALRAVAGHSVPDRIAPARLLSPRSLAPPTVTYAVDAAPLHPSAPASGASPPSRPSSVPLPSGWEEPQLARLEHDLARHIGPMARVLVRRAAQGQTDIRTVRRLVAAAIQDGEVRERFLAETGESEAARGPASRSGASQFRESQFRESQFRSSRFPETRPATPEEGLRLQPGDVDKVAAALAQSLGPIAKVFTARCAEGAVTREQFVATILERMAAKVDVKALETLLWRSLR